MFKKFFKWIVNRFINKRINKIKHQYHNDNTIDIDKSISTINAAHSDLNKCIDDACDLTNDLLFNDLPEFIVAGYCLLWCVAVEIILSPIGIVIKILNFIADTVCWLLNIKEGESHV